MLNKLRILLFCAMLPLPIGCATWHHPLGYGDEVLNSDKEHCKSFARKYAMNDVKVLRVGFFGSDATLSTEKRLDKGEYKKLFNECMEAKGWSTRAEYKEPTKLNPAQEEMVDQGSRDAVGPSSSAKRLMITGDYLGTYTVQFLNAQPFQNKAVITIMQRDQFIFGMAQLQNEARYVLNGEIKENVITLEAKSKHCNDSAVITGSHNKGIITLSGSGEAFSDCGSFVGPYTIYGVFNRRE